MESKSTTDLAYPDETPIRARGRPRKADPKSQAERAKSYRDRLKADGLKEVKCYLNAEHLAYLKGICSIHGVSIAEAISMALGAVILGNIPVAPLAGDEQKKPTLILLQ